MASKPMSDSEPRIIVALDYPDAQEALALVDKLSPELCRLKVGKELFTAAGPQLVQTLVSRGYDVFLDLKFHDIPNTVRKAVTVACRLGVWMLNVHALGGRDMMVAARDAVQDFSGERRPFLIAVSILTSTDQNGLQAIGIEKNIGQAVMDLTTMALDAGVDGMVCSAREVEALRDRFGERPVLVTPGIRPAGASQDDQHRIVTPERAIQLGSTYLVIGRPVTQHADPIGELARIKHSLES